MGRFSDPTSPSEQDSGRFTDPVKEPLKRGKREKLIQAVFLIVAAYLSIASITFAVRHPAAGDGAWFVYFKEVLTFQKVDELSPK